MKKKFLYFLFFVCFSAIFQSCSTINQTISVEQDAKLAKKLQTIDVQKFKYDEMDSLKNLISEQIKKYEMALGYLKKSANLYKESEGAIHHRRIAEVTIEINYLRAILNNFENYYPDQWTSVLEKLSDSLEKIRSKYQTACKDLI